MVVVVVCVCVCVCVGGGGGGGGLGKHCQNRFRFGGCDVVLHLKLPGCSS